MNYEEESYKLNVNKDNEVSTTMFTYDNDHDFSGFWFYNDNSTSYAVNDKGEIISSNSGNFKLGSNTFVRRISLNEGEIGKTQSVKNSERMVYIEKKDMEVSDVELVETSIDDTSLLYNRDTLLITNSNNENYLGSYYVEFVDSSNNMTKLIVNLNLKTIMKQTGSTYYNVDVLENTLEETTRKITREDSNPKVNFNLKDGDDINSNIIYAYRSRDISDEEFVIYDNDGISTINSVLLGVHLVSDIEIIGENAFRKCANLKQMIIPNSVTTIGDYVFYECTSLEQVTVSNNLSRISRYAFCGCTGLKQVTIPNSITSIDEYAFNDCSSLEQITIPINVTFIYVGTFRGCTSLEQVTIPNNIKSLSEKAFTNCNNIETIIITNYNDVVTDNNGNGINDRIESALNINDYTKTGETDNTITYTKNKSQ